MLASFRLKSKASFRCEWFLIVCGYSHACTCTRSHTHTHAYAHLSLRHRETGCQVTPPSVRGNQPSSQVMLSDQLEGLNLIAVTWNQGPDPAVRTTPLSYTHTRTHTHTHTHNTRIYTQSNFKNQLHADHKLEACLV